MKYKLDTTENELHIEVTESKQKQQKLIEAFQECQEGRCTCPTEEYSKLDTLEIDNSDDTIRLKLKAKSDEKFDEAEIKKCLDYTKEKLASKN